MRTRAAVAPGHAQRGFSLVEVLVTMLVLSIGLLGIAALIITDIKNNQSAYARSQASMLANDIIDSMRANRALAEASPSPYALALDADPAGAGVAADDLTAWRAAAASAMPSGRGAVSVDPLTRNVTVTLEWNDSRAGGAAHPTQQYVVATHL